MPHNFSRINLDFCSNVILFFFFFLLSVGLKLQFFAFRSFALHPYHTNIKVASFRKLVRYSGVDVCITTTGKV